MAKKESFDYFDAFAKQADKAAELASVLLKMFEEFTTAEDIFPIMMDAHAIENDADKILHSIHGAVATDFITPVNREDILALASTLDDVSDQIESTIQRCYMFNIQILHENAIPFTKLICTSCGELQEAMKDFRNFKKSQAYREHVLEIDRIEEEGDVLLVKSIRSLYKGDGGKDPMRALVWKEIFERLESALDSVEHAADVMDDILLTNS